VLLEQWSDEDRRSPGWAQRPLVCQFNAHAFAPFRRCYLLPGTPLQRAWRMCGRRWLDRYGQRRTRPLTSALEIFVRQDVGREDDWLAFSVLTL
jgi:hypothetical protein